MILEMFQAQILPFHSFTDFSNPNTLYFCGAVGVIGGNVRYPLTTVELPRQPEEDSYLT